MKPLLDKYTYLQASNTNSTAVQSAPSDRTAAQLLNDLRALATLLGRSDMLALEAHARIRQSHGNALGEELTPLDAAMARLDFEVAGIVCQSLIERHLR